jgi:hypothetical protein
MDVWLNWRSGVDWAARQPIFTFAPAMSAYSGTVPGEYASKYRTLSRAVDGTILRASPGAWSRETRHLRGSAHQWSQRWSIQPPTLVLALGPRASRMGFRTLDPGTARALQRWTIPAFSSIAAPWRKSTFDAGFRTDRIGCP